MEFKTLIGALISQGRPIHYGFTGIFSYPCNVCRSREVNLPKILLSKDVKIRHVSYESKTAWLFLVVTKCKHMTTAFVFAQ